MRDDNKIEFVKQFKVLFLNKAGKVFGIYEVSIIISHNHPSGNLKPSSQGEELTDKIKCGGQYLEIKLLDHLIVNNEGYFSFADEGLL